MIMYLQRLILFEAFLVVCNVNFIYTLDRALALN